MADPTTVLESTLDRLVEAAYHLRQMENSYHDADQFRWNLNSFLRSVKELPQLMQMELQNLPECEAAKELIKAHRDDPLTRYIHKQRDIVVHKEMLKPSSSGSFGITEGRGLKIGLGIPIDPLEDSDAAMMRAMQILARTGDFLGFLEDDEESLPCVQREWKLETFPDTELVELCAQAWDNAANLMSDAVELLGGDRPALKFERGPFQAIRIKMYDREKLRAFVDFVRESLEENEADTE